MNIELGIGIGGGSLFAPTSSDQLVAYAWASAVSPSVSTSSVVHTTVNAILANSGASALSPTVSSAGNAMVSSVIANANGGALIPSVAIAGSISINAVIASSNADSIIPSVSTIRNVSVGGVIANSTASAGVPTVTAGSSSAVYYIQLDGVDDKLVVPHPANTKYIVLKVKRHPDTNGYLFDFRVNNTIYCAYGATGGYTTFKVDATSYGVSGSNISTQLQDNVLHDVLVTIASSSTSVGNMTMGTRYSGEVATDYLTVDIYDIKFLDASSVVIQSFNFTTGSGTTLYGTAGNGTLTGGTWVVA